MQMSYLHPPFLYNKCRIGRNTLYCSYLWSSFLMISRQLMWRDWILRTWSINRLKVFRTRIIRYLQDRGTLNHNTRWQNLWQNIHVTIMLTVRLWSIMLHNTLPQVTLLRLYQPGQHGLSHLHWICVLATQITMPLLLAFLLNQNWEGSMPGWWYVLMAQYTYSDDADLGFDSVRNAVSLKSILRLFHGFGP